ncbi:predicted protein [Naegleria gruberi]|uniref:Predicted protein n=1 Tax=Naegleria gruberi TaxID=5762 RepID=D2V082_NAEGR|nr:uncharacterized protein NAEGRDRAFT_62202 [Naegleria gruberi]EFC49480.1 predicted protein [Naegleria gruberi]|eukprot:XP_002682224.1 predicted protein [Naegleria gruberi strain NEG-M]
MNKITLCILFALVVLVALVSAQQQEEQSPAQLLRSIARRLYPNSSDRQIAKKLFPGIRKLKKPSTDKLLSLISALSDSQSFDCARYCAGSTGDYKVSCYQHCQRYNL